MAERYGDELAAALPEVDLVAGFGESLIAPFDAGGAAHARDAVVRSVESASPEVARRPGRT